jgi:predicted GIY-YIG superfamily endonuclease
MTGIYAIHNIVNDKYYIGQAQDINDRWIKHRSRLKNNYGSISINN